MRRLLAPFAVLIDNWSLCRRLLARDFSARYKESILGVVWAVATPLLMLSAYSFVFGLVLKPRWPQAAGVPFTLMMYSGLLFVTFFVECTSRAPQLVIANANYVKKVVFPIDLEAWVSVLVALAHLGINYVIFLLATLVAGVGFHPQALLAPLVAIPFVLTTMGLVWIISALTVYVRDLGQIVPVLASLTTLFSPIFFPLALVPLKVRWVVWANPVTPVIEFVRGLVFQGQLPDIGVFAASLLSGLLLAVLGHAFFSKLRRGFADVL
jgi:lipopolysaccharide transport system permease protein